MKEQHCNTPFDLHSDPAPIPAPWSHVIRYTTMAIHGTSQGPICTEISSSESPSTLFILYRFALSDTCSLVPSHSFRFALLKQKNRSLKLLLSVGGWTFSSHFPPAAADPKLRANFVASSIRLLQDYGLDGLDIDWEYPSDQTEAQNYVDLLKELRQGLTELSKKKGCQDFLLTIAAPCGADHYSKMKLKDMDQYLDFWNLMAYDYSGSWEPKTGHQANLFGPPPSTKVAVDYYVAQGVPIGKLVMGMPLYGRSFENTDGLGKPYEGVGQGSWEPGLYDYKVGRKSEWSLTCCLISRTRLLILSTAGLQFLPNVRSFRLKARRRFSMPRLAPLTLMTRRKGFSSRTTIQNQPR